MLTIAVMPIKLIENKKLTYGMKLAIVRSTNQDRFQKCTVRPVNQNSMRWICVAWELTFARTVAEVFGLIALSSIKPLKSTQHSFQAYLKHQYQNILRELKRKKDNVQKIKQSCNSISTASKRRLKSTPALAALASGLTIMNWNRFRINTPTCLIKKKREIALSRKLSKRSFQQNKS